ncbi:MAG: efflux RND transporter permease subunit [Leptospiraceae bacterium]|nr:efflux RND transporter permease subunit [Leptospiraceae bacterium]MCP5497300.1 efflux RND transporter permease subunit [Leptospiraceae bacterium]
MIKSIIKFSVDNKFFVLIFTGFLLGLAYYSMKHIPLDAIPDLSDTQVIVYSRWDRSPDIIEDQVTYPIITALLGAPKVKVIRGFSDFGFSFVYVIFEDGTDIYWARSRVLEYLSQIKSNLPEGVNTTIGPDATGVGWVYQYALLDKSGENSLHELRTLQDFKLKYILNSVKGVSEVASIGGFKKQYQIHIDPNKLIAYDIPLSTIIQNVKDSNNEVGARLIEFSGTEYMIRGKGYAKNKKDLEEISLGVDKNGVPVLLRNIADITIGPDLRRGVADLDGMGDTVGGIVVMRHGENALAVIERVKEKIESIKHSLPKGVEIITVYDRSDLINKTIDNLTYKLVEEIILVSLIILIFLWHFPSAIIPIMTIPISVILSFIPLFLADVGSNLMSLAGIAISIGVLVDGAIVEVENAYKKLEEWEVNGRVGDYHVIRLEALMEVGPSVFFSLLIIAVAFFPIFTLVEHEGRLFRPLALSKNLAMAIASILAITLDPAVRMLFTRMEPFTFKYSIFNKIANALVIGTYYPEEKHPVSKILFRLYNPVCNLVLKHPKWVVGSSVLMVILTIPVYMSLGTEFMPPLYEGSFLYMPTTLPGISISQAEKLLVAMDKKLKQIPEVDRVFGKAGRADTPTDSAPLSMIETVILLKPEKEWRPNINKDDLKKILDKEISFPGVSNAWTMPIKARIDMLSTGLRTSIGIKIQGESLEMIEKIGVDIEGVLKKMKGTRSVFAERTTSGYYLDINLNRSRLARYGISIKEAQDIILTAIGGEAITYTIEGRERYSVNIRYPREMRDTVEKMKRILVPSSTGAHIPIGEIAEIEFVSGQAMIRDENGFLTGYVYVDSDNPDVGRYVEEAKELVKKEIVFPTGYTIQWTGQYENILRVRERMKVVVPITISIIMFLLYFNLRSVSKTLIVLMAVPFSLIGAVLLLFVLGYQVSAAVWVGMIALMGLDAETGVFMLLYLELSYEEARKQGKLNSILELKQAITHGAVNRVRPKIMTVLSAFLGLLPVMWASGVGSDMMKRIAAPMVGGLFTSFLLELLVYPAVYFLWKKQAIKS